MQVTPSELAQQSTPMRGLLLLVGGPAGAGKSTLAAGWCATRQRAAHLQLDHVRDLIVAGRADPQHPGVLQGGQYALSVQACCALARVFLEGGYDVVIDDVLAPVAFDAYWRPLLVGLDWRLVIVLPSLAETLRRSARREKRVLEAHSRAQHAACSAWPDECRLDSTGLTVQESVGRLEAMLRPSGASRTTPDIRGESIRPD